MTPSPSLVSAGSPPPAARTSGDGQVITLMVVIQAAIALGFFAVMAHVVAHLRDGLGLTAGTIGLVLGLRVGVQYALLLPVGALTDLLGAARAGVVACALRAAGFALLGTAKGLPELVAAAVLLGAGGALFHPAAQSVLAGLSPERRARGFAAYIATQHAAAVAGPPLGLALLALGAGVMGSPDGFGLLAGAAATAWTLSAGLFLLLRRHLPRRDRGAGGRAPDAMAAFRGVRAVAGDRTFLLFVLATAPTTLLVDQAMTVVPLKGFSPEAATLFFCVLAASAAAAQPWVASRRRGERPWVLRCGLLLGGASYLVLVPLDGADPGPGWMLAAVLGGLASGLVQPALFQRVARHATPERFGTHFGVLSFLHGTFAFAGGLVVGRLFDLGAPGATLALAGLAALGAAAALLPGRRAALRTADRR
ncbi:MFS transporter [Actinomadura viridis]|nr:MFS transporter [Actinomadura viridis]